MFWYSFLLFQIVCNANRINVNACTIIISIASNCKSKHVKLNNFQLSGKDQGKCSVSVQYDTGSVQKTCHIPVTLSGNGKLIKVIHRLAAALKIREIQAAGKEMCCQGSGTLMALYMYV